MGQHVDDGSGSLHGGWDGYRGADDRQGAREGVDCGELVNLRINAAARRGDACTMSASASHDIFLNSFL